MKKYLLILMSLILAFVFSAYSSDNIFIAKTPKTNPFYLVNLQNKFKNTINSVYLALNFKNSRQKKIPNNNLTNIGFTTTPFSDSKINFSKIPENLFKPISKGVSAYEGENDNVILRIDEGRSYKVSEMTLPNGHIIKIIDLTGQ